MNRQLNKPIWEKLRHFQSNNPVSFHVPGHKNGKIMPSNEWFEFKSLLTYDLTELTGLDDLHNAEGIIEDAQQLAAEWFQAQKTYFLVNGSTVGNLAMILATCGLNDQIIVQRNCHKSIINGLELSGADPIFISPDYCNKHERYTFPSLLTIKKAIDTYSNSKAILLTYPDYYGHTFALKEVVKYAHSHNMLVLIDEAHGVHFSLPNGTPLSAVELGADLVVQSAHKMAPALTMTAFLHVGSDRVDASKLAYYLSALQSSSPSYLLLASLDLARYYLANLTVQEMAEIEQSVLTVRAVFARVPLWRVLPQSDEDDFLKITLNVEACYSTRLIANFFEQEGIYPELVTDKHLLFVHGLASFTALERLEATIEKLTSQLSFFPKRATIERKKLNFISPITHPVYSSLEMKDLDEELSAWGEAIGKVSAKTVIPYPPGIPVLLKGEQITEQHVQYIQYLIDEQINFQQSQIAEGVFVFKGE
ncbi:lysine decarboxylase [Amphibacillus marinus]|uniref:Lysine decarboxylase n=1 Tax=Amphibacillus marinus TaxID=872970 RepID=A0A1H8PBF5_9BACI|nr:aminotransferase class V-fold PLP-dependent enzyme [Amphibacillus marinus]SEO39131.1 lysine decarboxylase [Amphibacillus marinus]